MEFWDVVEGRHSVRGFTGEPVDRADMERVLSAAALAPSAMNAQPWTFHVCTGESREAVGKALSQATAHLTEFMDVMAPEHYDFAVQWYSTLGNAPVVIAVEMEKAEGEWDTANRLLSVGTAVENLLLAAHAEGLGACNITFSWWVRGDLEQLLGISEGNTVVALIALGHPAATPPAPPKRTDVAVWHE